MPRNRSEKVPTLEGVDQQLIDVLIADAKGNHRDGVAASSVRAGETIWTHYDGNAVHARLRGPHSGEWTLLDNSVKRAFVADYMEYLYAT